MKKYSDSKINFRFLNSDVEIEGVDACLSIESVRKSSMRYTITLCGYFIGSLIAFPIVQNYVKNVWSKFGLEKTMMTAKGFFFFKFANQKGMMDVLEGGPWMIHNSPFFLNKWSPNVNLSKEDHESVPVWVKLHDIPIAGFTNDGVSIIASCVGKPMMLDSYTSSMCVDAWGRPSYARAMIEVSAGKALCDKNFVATPCIDGSGSFTKEVVRLNTNGNRLGVPTARFSGILICNVQKMLL